MIVANEPASFQIEKGSPRGQNDDTNSFTGWRKKYFEDGTLKKESHYRNGKRDGWTRIYYRSEQLHKAIYYHKGECAGRWMEWYEDGPLKKMAFCKIEGRRYWGPKIEWYENGNFRSIEYPSGGREVFFHYDGKPKKVVDDHRDGRGGVKVQWLPDGSTLSAQRVLDQQKVGTVPEEKAKELYAFYLELNAVNKGRQRIPGSGRFTLEYPGMKAPLLELNIRSGRMHFAHYDGRSLGKATFKDEKLHGPFLLLHPGGDTLYYGEYKAGDPVLTVHYHKNGKRKEAARFDPGGSTPWSQKKFYDNGVLRSSYELTRDGLGKHTLFYRSGAKKYYGEFYDPRRTDPDFLWANRKDRNIKKKWYESGELKWIMDYDEENPTERARELHFYKNGDTAKLMEYEDGQLNGRYAEWREDGSLELDGEYKNDKKNGSWTYYTRSEEVDASRVYNEGQRIEKKPRRSCYCKHYHEKPEFLPKLYQITDSVTIEQYNNGTFPSVEETASKLFFAGNPKHNNLELIADRPLDLWFSNRSMLRLRLNPCRHTNSVSHTEVKTAKHPFELLLFPDTIEISFSPTDLLPIGVERKPPEMYNEADRVKFLFKVSRISYDRKSVDLEDTELLCSPDFRIPWSGIEIRDVSEAVPVLVPRISVNWENAMELLNETEAGPLKDSVFDKKELAKKRSVYIRDGELTLREEDQEYSGELELGVMSTSEFTGCVAVQEEDVAQGLLELMKGQKYRLKRSVRENGRTYIYFTHY